MLLVQCTSMIMDVIRQCLLEKDTSTSTVIGTFNSDSGVQLNSIWSFLSLECEIEKQRSWITKIDPELMMEVSLLLCVRQSQDGQNHLFSDSKTSDFKNLEREELIFGGNGIASMSVSYLAEKQKH